MRNTAPRPAQRASRIQKIKTTAKHSPADGFAADGWTQVLGRRDALVGRIERLVPPVPAATDWKASIAFRWRKRGGRGHVQPVLHMHKIQLADLRGVDRQKQVIEQNTRQFVAGLPANNVLLTGARGTGKSSLVKACLNKYARQGLRLIEGDKLGLVD